MYHSPSRRSMLLKRFTSLIITFSAVLVGVSIVTAFTLGYGLNEKDGKIERGGILQLGSTPSGAAVTINNVPFSSRTPTKLVSYEGDYAVKMELPLYKTWQKTVPINPGAITWQTYARLFPKEIKPTDVASFETMAGALPSGSGRNYAFLEKMNQPVVTIAPLDAETVNMETITLPQTIATQSQKPDAPSTYELMLWSGKENYILIKHVIGDTKKVEWLVLDIANPEDSINLTKSYGIDASEVVFSNYNGREIVALIDGTVRQIDLDAQTLSRPFARNVNNFRLYGDEYILYVTNPLEDNTQEVGYVRKEFKQPFIIKKVPYDGKATALVDFGKYFDKYYALISHGNTASFYEMKDFNGSEKDTLNLRLVADMSLEKPITTLDITDNSQFATVQDGFSFANYNLELNQQNTTKIVSSADKPQKLRHLDTYLYWGTEDGYLRTYEFDGANQNRLMAMDPIYDATLSPSGKYLYSVVVKDGKYNLQRLQILGL